MPYSGKRIPRDNDPEKWKIFFKLNPERREEFKEKWLEINPPKLRKKRVALVSESEEILNSEKLLMTSKDERSLSNLVGTLFWSELLGASITITRVDLERDIIYIRINKLAKLTVEEFTKLPMEHFGSNITNNTGLKKAINRQADYYDEETITAFRQFRDFLVNKKTTPMREWVEKNLK